MYVDRISWKLGIFLVCQFSSVNGQSLQTPIQMVSIRWQIVQQPSLVEFVLCLVLKRSLFKVQAKLPEVGIHKIMSLNYNLSNDLLINSTSKELSRIDSCEYLQTRRYTVPFGRGKLGSPIPIRLWGCKPRRCAFRN